MTRTQIQLPDALHAEAKRFAKEREISLAETIRRGLEQLLSLSPPPGPRTRGLPVLRGRMRKGITEDRINKAIEEDRDSRF